MKRLNQFLLSIGLPEYLEIFIEKGIHSVDSIINSMKEKHKISYNDILHLRISKPGHIYRILTKLEWEVGNINNKLGYLLNDPLKFSSGSLNLSIEKHPFCYIFNETNCTPKNTLDGIRLNLNEFLQKSGIAHLRKNFTYNGFESMTFIYLQMFTEFPITKEILKSKLHIYERKDRVAVLKALEIGK